jgi:histidyl-tRNA synthetase
MNYLKSLGLNKLSVDINSLGCPACREIYKKRIKETLKDELKNLCPDCQTRYEKNPLRLLDCKVDSCKEIFAQEEIQKVIKTDYICEDCSKHFEELKSYLDKMNINYNIDKLLVRGLDYYNRTVFEIKSNDLGSQNAVCGGGRYDSLVKNLGGEDTPAVGWAMVMERLNSLLPEKISDKLNVYVVSNSTVNALDLVEKIRENNISADFDMTNKKFTKQMEKASKVADFAVILGEDEIKENKVSVKNLKMSEQITIPNSELINFLQKEMA